MVEYFKIFTIISFTIFFDVEEIISEIFNISENNIISFELAKVLGYLFIFIEIGYIYNRPMWENQEALE
jgi:hypothetical protein